MEKPNPSNLRSYFKPIREAGISSRDVEKIEVSFLDRLLLLISVVLAGYAWYSWSILVATFSGAAFVLFMLIPAKKTMAKETIRETLHK